MKVSILQLIEGARQAEGLTVIIDVFRAFSLECYMFHQGVKCVKPVGSVEEAWALKRQNPGYLLVWERGGKMCEGFDFGNSPSRILNADLSGKTVLHTTSAGTQGIVNAVHAEEILTGSLVNARAVAQYIKERNPQKVSLVCMGNGGVREAREDVICAKYMESLLLGTEFDIDGEIDRLRTNGGEHFFDPDNQDVFPEEDFWLCIKKDSFPFVLKVGKAKDGTWESRRVDL